MTRLIPIREGGEPIKLSAFEAVVRSTIADALKGSFRAKKLCIEMTARAQADRIRDMAKQVQWVEQYRASWPNKAWVATRQGKPPPLPHPDHVNFSIERGVLEITGPTDRKQQAAWNELKAELRKAARSLGMALRAVKKHPDDERMQSKLASRQRIFRTFEAAVPHGWNWREELQYPPS